MLQYFVHNGYLGASYGAPADPQLVIDSDAEKLIELSGLTRDQVDRIVPAAQYAEDGEELFHLTNGNRFLFLGDWRDCADINPAKVEAPLAIKWPPSLG